MFGQVPSWMQARPVNDDKLNRTGNTNEFYTRKKR